MWVASGAGRVFVSDNVDSAAPAVVWTRIDDTAASSPRRYPSAIAVDPANPHHAWVSYSGYNLNTPATPGHVFESPGTAPRRPGRTSMARASPTPRRPAWCSTA